MSPESTAARKRSRKRSSILAKDFLEDLSEFADDFDGLAPLFAVEKIDLTVGQNRDAAAATRNVGGAAETHVSLQLAKYADREELPNGQDAHCFKAFAEALRILKPGGRLAIVPSRHEILWTSKGTAQTNWQRRSG